jgi:hypothetical protein
VAAGETHRAIEAIFRIERARFTRNAREAAFLLARAEACG